MKLFKIVSLLTLIAFICIKCKKGQINSIDILEEKPTSLDTLEEKLTPLLGSYCLICEGVEDVRHVGATFDTIEKINLLFQDTIILTRTDSNILSVDMLGNGVGDYIFRIKLEENELKFNNGYYPSFNCKCYNDIGFKEDSVFYYASSAWNDFIEFNCKGVKK